VPVLLTGYLLYEEVRSSVKTDDAIVSDPLGETVLSAGVATGSKATAKGAKKLVPALSNAWKGLVKTVKQKIAVGSEIVGNEVGAVGGIGRTTKGAGGISSKDIKEAEKHLRQNRDFTDWFHRIYKPKNVVPSKGRHNPDMSPEALVEALEEWKDLGKPKVK